jgi:hypothetical protein
MMFMPALARNFLTTLSSAGAGDGAVLGQLPQLVGEVREERVQHAAALVVRQAVEQLVGGQARGRGEDVGLGIAGPHGGVERALDRELLGDRLEDQADREIGREVGEGALDRGDAAVIAAISSAPRRGANSLARRSRTCRTSGERSRAMTGTPWRASMRAHCPSLPKPTLPQLPATSRARTGPAGSGWKIAEIEGSGPSWRRG